MRMLPTGHGDGPAPRLRLFRLPGTPRRFPGRLATPGLLVTVAIGAMLLPLLHFSPAAHPSARAGASSIGLAGTFAHSSAPTSKPGAWLRLSPPSGVEPPMGTGAAMAYDPATSSVVLFGGCDTGACPTDQTWAFSAGNWTNLSGSLSGAPSARSGSSLAYDVHDHLLVLFGGRTSAGLSGETWVFDGSTWSQLSPSSPTPSARTDARLTYDPTLAGVVLFGGIGPGGHTLGDVWEFASGQWLNLTNPSGGMPAARSGTVFVYDPSDGYDLLFGGNGLCGHPCADTWSYANHAWTNLTASFSTAPAARFAAGGVYDPSNNGVLVFGGRGSTSLHDSWSYGSGVWTDLSSLGIRALPGHASPTVAYDAADGYIVALGSRTVGPPMVATWAFVLPLTATLLASTTSVGPGQTVQLTAFVVGGVPPYRYSIDPGTGSAGTTSPRLVLSYPVPGSYRATLNVSDSRGVYGVDQILVHVNDLPLHVTLSVSPGTVQPGSTATFSATITGGRAPYNIGWVGLPANCPTAASPTLSCAPRLAGDYRVTVTVTDARNASSVAAIDLNVPGPQPAGSSAGAPSATTTQVMPVGWVLVPPLAAGLVLTTLGALMMWKAARRVPPPPPPRPLCYMPPEWSETPDEYRP